MERPHGWVPSQEQKERLLHFEGYGPDDPQIVFMGLEEHCDSMPELQEDAIWRRCTRQEFAAQRVDRNAAHKALEDIESKKRVRVWEVMASIVEQLTRYCFFGSRDPIDHGAAYNSLGSRPAQAFPGTWLTELRPLPRPSTNSYQGTYIKKWFSEEFPTKKSYDSHCSSNWDRLTCSMKSATPPRYVFFYGVPTGRVARERLMAHGAIFKDYDQGIAVGQFGQVKCVVTGFYRGQHKKTSFELKHIDLLCEILSGPEYQRGD